MDWNLAHNSSHGFVVRPDKETTASKHCGNAIHGPFEEEKQAHPLGMLFFGVQVQSWIRHVILCVKKWLSTLEKCISRVIAQWLKLGFKTTWQICFLKIVSRWPLLSGVYARGSKTG